ncbi:MAG: hypothetical protein RM021_006455 [Nostoc sp. EkiNYC01]
MTISTDKTLAAGTERLGLANIQFFLGILAFVGYIWHSWRSPRQVKTR